MGEAVCSSRIIRVTSSSWLPNKIDLMAKVFESGTILAHTDAQLVDANARDLEASLFKTMGLSR